MRERMVLTERQQENVDFSLTTGNCLCAHTNARTHAQRTSNNREDTNVDMNQIQCREPIHTVHKNKRTPTNDKEPNPMPQFEYNLNI